MATFNDSTGREWDVRLSLAALPRLREAGLNISLATRDPRAFRVLEDPDVLGRVLWVLLGAQAEARGLTPETFAAAFDGPAIYSFHDALEVAIVDFTLPPKAAARTKERLPGVKARAEAAALDRIDRALAGAPMAEIPTPSGSNDGGGNSPAPPDSTAAA